MRGDADHRPTSECPKGGLLTGTNKPDQLEGKDSEDEIRGLGAADGIVGGDGNDVIYGGPGDDSPLVGGDGDDVIWGETAMKGRSTPVRARTSSTVGMAAILFSRVRAILISRLRIGNPTSSIAEKARTNMLPTRTTLCRAAARRRQSF
jgi:hypothetical protein